MPAKPNFPVWLELSNGTAYRLKGPCSLGRSSENSVQLNSLHASRWHAVIQPQDAGSYWLVDLGSTHGTYLNEHRVVLRKQLADGDRLDLGGEKMVFHSSLPAVTLDPLATGPTLSHPPGHAVSKMCWLLIADVEGFTKLSQLLPGNGLAVIVGTWVRSSGKIIERHRGVLNKYLGDGFLAYWWHQEDVPQHICDTLAELREVQQTTPVPFRLILHYGQVDLGLAASNGEECFFGSPVNFAFKAEKVASRLKQHVLLTAEAAKMLGECWRGQAWPVRQRVPSFPGLFEFFVPAGTPLPPAKAPSASATRSRS